VPKYYIKSGELERIVNAKTPQEACEKAIETCKGETINPYTFSVDERGFRESNGVHSTDTITSVVEGGKEDMEPKWTISTDDVIKTVGFETEDIE